MEGVKLSFDHDAIEYIVDKADSYGLGARGLRGICEAIMTDAMFELPSETEKITDMEVGLTYAREKFEKSKFSRLKAA
jgi:ATP-dependent Clp protease ATP-binding subunit ClpX